jgi:hypothetical protein
MVFCYACAAPLERRMKRCPKCNACSARYLRTGGGSPARVCFYVVATVFATLLFEMVWMQKNTVLRDANLWFEMGHTFIIGNVAPRIMALIFPDSTMRT